MEGYPVPREGDGVLYALYGDPQELEGGGAPILADCGYEESISSTKRAETRAGEHDCREKMDCECALVLMHV